jgi:hypothetical protein
VVRQIAEEAGRLLLLGTLKNSISRVDDVVVEVANAETFGAFSRNRAEFQLRVENRVEWMKM